MIQYLNTLTGDGWLPASLDVVAKSSVLLVLASIACWLLRGCTAALRHRIWTIALAGCVAVPVVAVVGPQLQIPLLRTKPVVQKIKTSSAATVNSAECSEVGSGLTNTTQPQSAGDSNEALSSGLNATFSCASTVTADTGGISTDVVKAAAAVRFFSWQECMLAIWLAGFVLLMSRLFTAVFLQHRRLGEMSEIDDVNWKISVAGIAKQLGVTRSFSTLQSQTGSVPMTYGIFRGVIVVPSDWSKWSDEHRHCVLSHELAHVQRCDVSMQLFARVVAALYWFNPLVWFAVYRLRVEREFACDDAVLLSGRRPSDYAEALLTTLRKYRRPRCDLGVAMADSARLDRRVEAILDQKRQRHPPGRTTKLFVMALGVCCVSLIGAATLTAVVVQRAQTVAGTVRDAVTGEPVENANVYVLGGTRKYTSPQYPVRTDRRGKFRLIRTKEELDFTVVVDGDKHLYLPASRTFTNVTDTGETTADFEIQRGILIRGKVVEVNTDRPIASEHRNFCDDIQPGPLYAGYAKYYPLKDNRWLNDLGQGLISIPFSYSQSNYLRWVHIDAKGEFQMAVPPGQGIVLIEAHPPRDTMVGGFVPQVPYLTIGGDITGTKPLLGDPKPSELNFPGMQKPIEADDFHTYKLIDPAVSESDPLDLRFEVNPAPSRAIHFVDPKGNPIAGVKVAGLVPKAQYGETQVRDVEDSDALVYFAPAIDKDRQIVAISNDGKFAVSTSIAAIGESPLTVKMQPTASLKFRLVDKASGKSPFGYRCRLVYGKGITSTGWLSFNSIEEFTTDKNGEITITSIIPGEPVSLTLIPPQGPKAKPQELESLTLEPGEVRKLVNVQVKHFL